MKKVLTILAALTILLSACGASNYEKVISNVESYIKYNPYYKDFENYTLGEYSAKEIAAKNDLLNYLDIDVVVLKMYNIYIINDDEYVEMDIIKINGDIDDYISQYQTDISYCVIKDTNIIDFNDSIEKICDKLNGQYYD